MNRTKIQIHNRDAAGTRDMTRVHVCIVIISFFRRGRLQNISKKKKRTITKTTKRNFRTSTKAALDALHAKYLTKLERSRKDRRDSQV